MSDGTFQIHLASGHVAIVDAADEGLVGSYSWRLRRGRQTLYAGGRRRGSPQTIMLHRLLMTPPPGFIVDHINRDGLDNRRSNLRIATTSQNLANRVAGRGSKSAYKGVVWHKRQKKWMAQIGFNYQNRFLGLFDDPADAARAYNEAAKAQWGEFARLNEIPDESDFMIRAGETS